MARLRYGGLTEAWSGEAADFTPLFAEQPDAVGAAIGVAPRLHRQVGAPYHGRTAHRFVAQVEDGFEFVIEHQYGRAPLRPVA